MKQFAILAVLGALLCSALVAGCGGGSSDNSTSGNSTNAATPTPSAG